MNQKINDFLINWIVEERDILVIALILVFILICYLSVKISKEFIGKIKQINIIMRDEKNELDCLFCWVFKILIVV